MPVTFVVNAERSVVLAAPCRSEALLAYEPEYRMILSLPAPAKMEHFGIVTVEAMLAGCVPLAPAHGGQVEIVEHGLSGYLCRNTEELVEHSARLAADHRSCSMRWAGRAADRGRMFNQSMFAQRIAQVVDGSVCRSLVDRWTSARSGVRASANASDSRTAPRRIPFVSLDRPTNRFFYASSLNHHSHI